MSNDTGDDIEHTIAARGLGLKMLGGTNRKGSREIVLVDRQKRQGFDLAQGERESGPSGTTQKRCRATAPKVRTGCQNCKIRRVKCDEGLPGCTRCFKYGIICSGYPPPPAKKLPQQQDQRSTIRALAPKSALVRQAGMIKVSIPKMHGGSPRFADETESRYFRYYCEEIASQITGPFKTSLWDRLIPQASDLEPFIGDAVIALGALSKARKESKCPSLEMCLHRQYALQKYMKALKGMRDAINGNRRDIRKALIACLLVFCFESLGGHQTAASVHATSGVALLQQWNAECGHNDGGSPVGSVIEDDEIYPAIAALDFHALCFLDQRCSSVHDRLKTDLNHSIALMRHALNAAGQFTTLTESRQYGLLIIRRTFHFIGSFKIFLTNQCKVELRKWEEEDSSHLVPGNNAWSLHPSDPISIPQEIQQEYQEYMADIRRWEDASSAVLAKASEDPDCEDFVAATMMKIHARMTVVVLASTFSQDEISSDAFIDDFRSITTLSASILGKLASSDATYNFEIGILPALLQVGLHCRDRAVRGQGIALMHEGGVRGYREGIWDSGAVANISGWMRDTEEPWADESGFVPVEKRLTIVGVNMVLQDRRGEIICGRRGGKDKAEWEMVNGYISW